MTLEVRNITLEELAAFRKAEQYSFSYWSDDPIKDKDLQNINLDERFGAFADGQLAATYSLIPFKQMVRGVWKTMGGVAGVSCLPEYRRLGAVRALVLHGLSDMRNQGQVVSALHPFRDTFYARYGYVPTRGSMWVKVASSAFAHYLPQVGREPDEWRYERQPAVEMRLEYNQFLQQLILPSGFTFGPDLPQASWQERYKDWLMVRVMQERETEALAIYRPEKFAAEGTLLVREMHWHTLSGRDQLFAFFALHSEQTHYVKLKMPTGTDFQRWIKQPPTSYEVEIEPVPLMVRLVDVVGALADLPATVDGTLAFAYTDPQASWNSSNYQLTGQDGRLQARQTDQTAALQFTVEGLTALVYGSLPLAEVEHRGWVSGIEPDTRPLLEAWFPEEKIFNPYFF